MLNPKKNRYNCRRLYKCSFHDCSLAAQMNNRITSKSFIWMPYHLVDICDYAWNDGFFFFFVIGHIRDSIHATISHINYWNQVNSRKNLWKFWNVPPCGNKSGSFLYSMLQHIGRVAKPKVAARNCLRYLQTTLIMSGGGLVSEFMWDIVASFNSFLFS